MTRYDVIVVGRGIIGAPAARHLAEGGVSVALVGPDEPLDRTTSDGPFCSHPDEGRITRIAGRNGPWVELAARSIERYADIKIGNHVVGRQTIEDVSSFGPIHTSKDDIAGGDFTHNIG